MYHDRLWEGSCQLVLPRTYAASVLVPTVSHTHPPTPSSAGDPPTLADSRSKKNYNPATCGTKTTFTER